MNLDLLCARRLEGQDQQVEAVQLGNLGAAAKIVIAYGQDKER